MNETEARIRQLRRELDEHNYNYYVLNAPEISDQDFDQLMHELQDLEKKHPEHSDENSPTMKSSTPSMPIRILLPVGSGTIITVLSRR